jgi:hypothetical protein
MGKITDLNEAKAFRVLVTAMWAAAESYKSVMNRKDDLYPMYDSKGHIMYYLTDKELALRTLGPRPAKESKEYLDWKRAQMLEEERKEVLQEIIGAIVDNDLDTANKLTDKYQVVPSSEMIESEILKRKLSYGERALLKPIGKKQEYQLRREDTIY